MTDLIGGIELLYIKIEKLEAEVAKLVVVNRDLGKQGQVDREKFRRAEERAIEATNECNELRREIDAITEKNNELYDLNRKLVVERNAPNDAMKSVTKERNDLFAEKQAKHDEFIAMRQERDKLHIELLAARNALAKAEYVRQIFREFLACDFNWETDFV